MDCKPPTPTLFTSCMSFFQFIVIKDSLIDTFGSGAGFHILFPFLAITRYGGENAQVPFWLGVNGSTVIRRRTKVFIRAEVNFTKFKRTAVFNPAAVFLEFNGYHTKATDADRSAVFINLNRRLVFEITLVLLV